MTTKRKIIIVSVFLFVALFMLMSSLIFSVRSVEVVTAVSGEFGISADVKSNAGIKKNSSIFFINKKKVTAKIEKNMPIIKVDVIDRKFPDKVEIKVSVRQEMFFYEISTGTLERDYLTLDRDLKVIREMPYSAAQNSLIKISGIGADGYTAGDFVKAGILNQFVYEMVNIYHAQLDIKVFGNIEVDGSDIVLQTKYDNCVLTIKNFTSNTADKMGCLGLLNNDPIDWRNKTITIDYKNGAVDIEGLN